MTFEHTDLTRLRRNLADLHCRASLDLAVLIDLANRKNPPLLRGYETAFGESYGTLYASVMRLHTAKLIKTEFINGKSIQLRISKPGLALILGKPIPAAA